ncbi:MAG: radical SAM protein [Gammaproteobacteria bacterium]|nr:radical SAM protein [Gammaproteobacteria bacterium]
MLTFGPVPSRRLGRSLGINNIPPKSCTYSCVYCQVGATKNTEIVPRLFYTPEQIFREVEKHLSQIQKKNEQVDYLTFVPDGEPGLDIQLSATIERLRPLGIPIAIISNASLIWREEIRNTFAQADWVSLKVDAIDETLWRQINQPHPSLDHQAILDGMSVFANDFRGTLATESMIVKGLNDNDQTANDLAGFLGKLGPDIAFLSVPTRPPAEKSVHVPDEATLNRIYQIISRKVKNLELLTGYEGNAFASTGDVAEDLLSITSVHPMREEAVRKLLGKAGTHWHVVEQLIADEQLKMTEYEGRKFYVRRIPDKCE